MKAIPSMIATKRKSLGMKDFHNECYKTMKKDIEDYPKQWNDLPCSLIGRKY
jgi:hypothetical protein